MRIGWYDLGSARATAATDLEVTIEGFPVPLEIGATAARFLLAAEAPCCPGCAPRDPLATVAVFAAFPLPMQAGALRLTGTWRMAEPDQPGPRYQLHAARPLEPAGWHSVTRRSVLAAAGPLICLAACSAPSDAASARVTVAGGPTIDVHSHAGGIASPARMQRGSGFGMVADPMRRGGMAAICLAVVSDGPTHRIMADHRIHPYREPAPGELYAYGQLAFRRVADFAREQNLTLIDSAAALQAARPGQPCYIMAAEGADFLEGQVDRVDEALARWRLRHLQLTHYRVNELGDIQTETPVHGGLTAFGATVIRRCNQLGIVVDVAHGTYDLVRRAASVTTRPLVLSHTSLAARPGRFSRLISAEHARIIAATGGMIGIWPPMSIFPTLPAMAAGIARMVDATGIDHVGLGTDMRGLVGPSALPDYDRLPHLMEALLAAGFHPDEVAKLLGGNYARVFAACVV